MYRNILAAASYAALGLCLAGQAHAQTIAPPRADTTSPTGVSFRSGAFTYQETDLSIGGSGSDGLTLVRSYNSSTNGPGNLSPSWSHNHQGFVSNAPIPYDPNFPPHNPNMVPYIYTVSFGDRSVIFRGGSGFPATGGPVGTYYPMFPSGASLVFNGTTSAGYYSFIDADGTVVNFTQGAGGKVSNVTKPDGTRLDYSYNGQSIRSIFSNRGWAILIESSTKACAVNLAETYVTATSSCPTGAQTVTYGYTTGTYNPINLLASATKNNQTTNYTYTGADHLGCIKKPGQSVCAIQNTYGSCPEDPDVVYPIQPDVHFADPVLSQQTATGETYTYTYNPGGSWQEKCRFYYDDPADYSWPMSANVTVMTDALSNQTSVTASTAGMPIGVTNPLGHTKSFGYEYQEAYSVVGTDVTASVDPEGNSLSYTRDTRGNITTATKVAKPGSGLPNIVTSAAYPTSCSNIITCNKPSSVTDARLNTTDYTYDPTHGGVLTESAPADSNGIRAVKRFTYVQRSAWIKNSSGTYSTAAMPVWLLSEERTCRTTATVGNACGGGTADEVVTGYEYGANSGPNNLLLRGKVVTADGVSLRTCYAYDGQGNKISETSPRGTGTGACQ